MWLNNEKNIEDISTEARCRKNTNKASINILLFILNPLMSSFRKTINYTHFLSLSRTLVQIAALWNVRTRPTNMRSCPANMRIWSANMDANVACKTADVTCERDQNFDFCPETSFKCRTVQHSDEAGWNIGETSEFFFFWTQLFSGSLKQR